MMEPKEQVFNALKKSSHPMKAGEISEQTGIDKNEVGKMIKKLGSKLISASVP